MKLKFWSMVVLIAFALNLQPQMLAADNTADILQRQTQELMDAVGTGSKAVWERFMDAKAIYTDESGVVMSKSQMIQEMRLLPPEVSGKIKIIEFKAAVQGTTAVTSHLDDEEENYHGHKLHCQYRTTDTWTKTADGWRLVGGQVLALRTDPPAIQLTTQQMDEYAGRYALTPTIIYEIRNKDGALEGQQSGRPAEALRAEVADMLFVPGKPRYRKVFLRGPDGRIIGF